jgi:general secretion pathway protein D
MRRLGRLILCVGLGLLAAGCPKGNSDYSQGRRAEQIHDDDAALAFYQRALAADPNNANYRIKVHQLTFQAGEKHIRSGLALRQQGNLQGAANEFQRAYTIDPSSAVAEQELRKTVEMIAEQARQAGQPASAVPAPVTREGFAALPPELKPLSTAPINLKMSNDAKIVLDTIAKLAGLTVVYDPDFSPRRISVELNNVTLQQALDIVSLESKTFWKPVTENIIFVIPDSQQKRRDYEEQLVRTFYVSNADQPQDLTEIVTMLRQILDLHRIQQINSQNAIVIRDTPDKLAIADKIIQDIDKAKPEVVVQVEVLSANTDRMRDLGILPGQSAALTFTPPGSTTTTGTTTTGGATSTTGIPLKQFHFSTADYSVTLPGATANMLLTDTATKIIQDPEIRSVDGQPAKLRVGQRVPIATGSFQAGVGVGTAAINPLVNTQFQYLDVGVNVDITPRVHPDHEISLKVKVEVSSVNGFQPIGGIQQPIVGQKVIDHDIRLKEGEVSVLGGLFERIDTKTLNGWPGLAKIPFLKYLTADNKTDHQENDVLIVLIPHIVRMPGWTAKNLQPIYSGSDTNVEIRREAEIRAPQNVPVTPAPQGVAPAAVPPQQGPGQVPGNPPQTPPAAENPPAVAPGAAPAATNAPRLFFQPSTLTLQAGQQATLALAVENIEDLFSVPLMLQYNPAVISIEDIQHGGFLSGGNQQEIAIVQRVDKEHGQAIISATRQPNTAGVSGSGTLMGIVVKALAPGATSLSIVQVNAKNSQQKPIPVVTGEATLQVQ